LVKRNEEKTKNKIKIKSQKKKTLIKRNEEKNKKKIKIKTKSTKK